MPDLEWFEPLSDEGDLLLVECQTRRGQMVDYAVRYEARIGDRTFQILLCDGSHGQGHCHQIDHRGQKISREWSTPGTSLGEAMNAAILDIKGQWQQHRDDFIRRSRMFLEY